MKYLSLIVPLFLAWIVCVNCGDPCAGYSCDHGSCRPENGKPACHCNPNYGAPNDPRCNTNHPNPIDQVPEGAEIQSEEGEARAVVFAKKCDAAGTNPAGCGFGVASLLLRFEGDFWVVYFYARVICCCEPCRGKGTGPGGPHLCREVFPNLGKNPFDTSTSWMCIPPRP